MNIVSASSTGWLIPRAGLRGYVELITSTTIYLHLQSDVSGTVAIVSVHDADGTIPRSPCSIHIENWSLVYAAGIKVDDAVVVDGDSLIICGTSVLRCRIDSSHEWAPTLSTHGNLNGVLAIDGPQLTDAETRLGSRWHELGQSLLPDSEFDRRRTASALRRIIGFGPGLTPSGDDALAGLLLGFRWWSENFNMFTYLRDLVIDCLESYPAATTSISTQVLRFACAGLGNEFVHNVLESVAYEDSNRTHIAAERLCQVGSTSGADTLVGLQTAAILIATRRLVRT
jgi:Protein of unknown function (DUF2877)